MDEQWFDIPGWEGVYQVTRAGQVKRIQLNIIQTRTKNNGEELKVPKKLSKERIKKWNFYRGEYRVHLTDKSQDKDDVYSIPKLLLLTFHPEIDLSTVDQISYKDNDPKNVQYDNLIISFK